MTVNTKDLKDYEGDKNSGVLTLPVLLGQRRSRIAIGVLDFVAYLAVPFILQVPLLIVPALVFGGSTFILICREKTPEKLFFLLLLLFLAIVLGRLAADTLTTENLQGTALRKLGLWLFLAFKFFPN